MFESCFSSTFKQSALLGSQRIISSSCHSFHVTFLSSRSHTPSSFCPHHHPERYSGDTASPSRQRRKLSLNDLSNSRAQKQGLPPGSPSAMSHPYAPQKMKLDAKEILMIQWPPQRTFSVIQNNFCHTNLWLPGGKGGGGWIGRSGLTYTHYYV